MAVGCAVLVVVFAASVFSYQIVAHSRYKVVGMTDPESGYRIEYTVSSEYRFSRVGWEYDLDQLGIAYSFSRPHPPSAVEWINTHILRKTPPIDAVISPGVPQGGIVQFVLGDMKTTAFKIDEQGYPNLTLPPTANVYLLSKHEVISGCNATWCSYSLAWIPAPQLECYALLVKPKDRRVIYIFETVDDPAKPTGAKSEMMKIKDSIRIVKTR